MKNLKLFLVVGIIMSFASCERQNDDMSPQNNENEVYKRILATGFAKNQIVEYKDYYLVEGDLMFMKNDKRLILKQASYGYVSNTEIKVYLNLGSFSSVYHDFLTSALFAACTDYNGLNSGQGISIHFTETTNPSEADITISNGMVSDCSASGLPSGGVPYPTIYINESSFNELTGVLDLEYTIVHNICHCIGLRHTNWYELGESYAFQIPGTAEHPVTDESSVMNSGTCDKSWNGFSPDDETALNYMYP